MTGLFPNLSGLGELLSPLEWRRLRYKNPEKAGEALALLIEGGASRIELRLRDDPETCGQKLYVGAERKFLVTLEEMAASFGLLLDTTPTKAPSIETGPGKKLVWKPGSLSANMKLTRQGCYVADTEPPDQSKEPGGQLLLPAPSQGLGVDVEMPYPPLESDDSLMLPRAWYIGDGGLAAPVGLVGEPDAKTAFLKALALASLTDEQHPRPTVVLDGTNQIAYHLKQDPAVIGLIGQGIVVELSPSRAGQLAFNPLAQVETYSRGTEEFSAEELTLQRWRFWLRSLNIYQDGLLTDAYRAGVRSLLDLEAHWKDLTDAKIPLHNLRALDADASVKTWLTGEFDPREHLRQGGHLLVDCSPATGPRLQALRALIGLVAETDARLLLTGVRLPKDDEPVQLWLDALCTDRRWDTTVLTRCTAEQVARAVKWFPDAPLLAEVLPNLPDGFALVNQGQGDCQWFTTQLTPLAA